MKESPSTHSLEPRRPPALVRYLGAVVIVGICAGVTAWMSTRFDRTNMIMVYLIGVVLAAMWFGRGPSVMASLLSVAAFDFFAVPPRFTFAVSDTQYLVTFGVMLATALIVSTLAVRLRDQAEEARQRVRRTSALYALSRTLADTSTESGLLEAAVSQVRETFDCDALLLIPDDQGDVRPRTVLGTPHAAETRERDAAQWAFEHGQVAGRGTAMLPSASGLYQPLQTPRGAIGVLGVYADPLQRLAPDRSRLLETFANQIALAFERAHLATDAERTRMLAESERMRNALLSSVSHDLRTPLASITGAASTLLQDGAGVSAGTRRELLVSIADQAKRLNRLVANLLEMTRVEAAGIDVKKEWHSIEEVVGAALSRVEDALGTREVVLDIPPDLPLVPFDPVSIEQVLLNLIENAVKYSPADAPITLRAEASATEVAVEVMDRGRGIEPGDEDRLFEKFYRGAQATARRQTPSDATDPGGMGLGLAICRAIVMAHGGTIRVSPRPGGGAIFRFTLPLAAAPPPGLPELTAGGAA